MSTELIEQKLADLTERVERLEKNRPVVAKATWREVIGTGKDDESSREAARLGEQWRRSEGAAE